MADEEQKPTGGAPWMRPPSVPGAGTPGGVPGPPTSMPGPAQGPGPYGAGGSPAAVPTPGAAGPPPTFVSPSAAMLGGRTGFGNPAGPGGPGGTGGTGGGSAGSGGGGRDVAHLLGAHHDEEPGERPLPSIGGAVGAAAGVLVFVGLMAILSDAKGENIRATGIFLSLIYLLGGFCVLLFTQSRRAVAGAVAITGLTVLPLMTYLFVDVDNPANTFDSFDSYRNTQMGILATSMIVWLALHLVGPGRRHGLYLGLALWALWSLPITYISTSAFESVLGGFDLGDLTDGGGSSGFGFGSGSESGLFDDPKATVLALGLVSLVIGLAYLAVGVLLDRGDDHRRGTPFFALTPIVLGSALFYLSLRYGQNWIATLGIALGALSIAAGTLGQRRFTTWIGGAAVAGGIVGLVGNNIDDAVPAGVTLTLLGLTVIVALAITEGAMGWGPSGRSSRPDGGSPFGPTPLVGGPLPVPGAVPPGMPGMPGMPGAGGPPPEAWGPPAQEPPGPQPPTQGPSPQVPPAPEPPAPAPPTEG